MDYCLVRLIRPLCRTARDALGPHTFQPSVHVVGSCRRGQYPHGVMVLQHGIGKFIDGQAQPDLSLAANEVDGQYQP